MSHATVQRNTQKLPHAAQELDVPPDGNCFYYAVGLAYLYPKIGDPVAFGKACDTLFHREGHEDVFNSE